MPKRRITSELLVHTMEPDGPAARAGLLAGDEVVAVNGRPARDAIDFMFEGDGPTVRLDVRRGTELRHVALLRDPGESFGVEFQDRALDQIITCSNKCAFCFLAGLKPGLRRTLYIKDDDYRLSFLHGNFITLSNLTEDDWERLEEQALSPLYVSVHATEPTLRHRMLGNTRSGDVLTDLDRLGRAGIRVHSQIVVIPGLNDGDHIERTVNDLAARYPAVLSVSVVPVGVTRYNHGGEGGALRPQTTDEARSLIEQVAPWQARFRERWDIDFVYLSDEVYLRAGRPVPPAARYDGFAQYENGVGMSRWIADDLERFMRRVRRRPADLSRRLRVGLVCGTMAAPWLARLAQRFSRASGIEVVVEPVVNDFWGHTVWISGLLAGADIAHQLADRASHELLFLSPKTLDASGRVLIDDWTPAQLEAALGTPIRLAQSFSELYRAVQEYLEAKETDSCAESSAT